MDHVIHLVKKVFSTNSNPIPVERWNDYVGVYSFYDDFLAEIPPTDVQVEDRSVAGCVLIPFVSPDTAVDPVDAQDTQLRYLEHAFNASFPSNIPRARISQNTQFYLSVVNREGDLISSLGLNAPGHLIHQPLDTPNRAIFLLQVENKALEVPHSELSILQYTLSKLPPNGNKQLMVSPAKIGIYHPSFDKTLFCLVYVSDQKQLMGPNFAPDGRPLEVVEFEKGETKAKDGRVLFEKV
jgi:hypothetical protein